MRRNKERTPNEIGSDLERKVAETLGGTPVKQSGGGKFWKLDVRGGIFIWSCKATAKRRLAITPDMFREAQRAARGVQGTGDGVRAGLISDIDGETVVLVSLADFAELLTGDIEPYLQPSKARERRMRARQ